MLNILVTGIFLHLKAIQAVDMGVRQLKICQHYTIKVYELSSCSSLSWKVSNLYSLTNLLKSTIKLKPSCAE